jgi:hypothetical protein
MTHDPLEALLRLRLIAVDEARRGLAECLRSESEAAAAVAAIEAAIERETEVATSLAAGDAEVEAFAAWLRRIRPKQRAYCSARHGSRCARPNRCWSNMPPRRRRRPSARRRQKSTQRHCGPPPAQRSRAKLETIDPGVLYAALTHARTC